jgi:hypothetical protein
MNPMPVTDAEAQQLAQNYNSGLRHKLGLDANGAEREPESKSLQLSIAPTFGAHGGGLAMRLEF